ncbi:hypothetical protein SKAU_G00400550 [Synaphobranchus kaupii]|uniref:Uncharacterized protein n=1 Tax=Synaphobranchus kaupii TaxID=118154 RepID=A0A9Q1E910_SYNKA|nr:hypothetical protein SKAU_G00400550 [Synaphobranchus kaupii]
MVIYDNNTDYFWLSVLSQLQLLKYSVQALSMETLYPAPSSSEASSAPWCGVLGVQALPQCVEGDPSQEA